MIFLDDVSVTAASGGTPSIPVLHLVNDSGQDIFNTLSSTVPFVTDFKGSNDVTVTKLTGSCTQPDSISTLGGAYSSGNPWYITNFTGSPLNGTGDGNIGDIEEIDTTNGLSLQFDFALRLTPQDRFFLFDCDISEQYHIRAFIKNGTNYTAESLVNWTVQYFPGSTEEQPNSSFPLWDGINGLLTAQTAYNLNDNLTVFTPDQVVDRVIVTQLTAGGVTDSAGLQFVNLTPVQIQSPLLAGTCFTFNFSTVSNQSYTIQQNTDLTTTNWTFYTNITGNGSLYQFLVPVSSNQQQFFRVSEP